MIRFRQLIFAFIFLFPFLGGCIDFVVPDKPQKDVVDPKRYDPWKKPEPSKEQLKFKNENEFRKKQKSESVEEFRRRQETIRKEDEKKRKYDEEYPVKIVVPVK